MIKSRIKNIVLFYIFISGIILLISKMNIEDQEQKQLHKKYTSVANTLKNSVSNLIDDKKNATLAFAISTSNNNIIKKSLLENNPNLLNFDDLSQQLKNETKFQNVWFQVITKEGNNFYRSWSQIRNGNLNFRSDIQNVLLTKRIKATISVGKFDMTFKSIVPLFEKEKFIGIFEVITHFNSIAKTLEEENIDLLVLANQRYYDNLKYPFTKKFIGKNYIANLNAKKYLIDLTKTNSVKKFSSIKNYEIVGDYLITTYTINENSIRDIGYLIISKPLSEIDTKDIKQFKSNALVMVFFTLLAIGALIIFITYNAYSKKVKKLNYDLKNSLKTFKKNEAKKQQILDSQKNIIIITDGKSLQNANIQLIKFFDQFKTFSDFKKKYNCICETFLDMNDELYVFEKDYDGKNWAEYILSNNDKKFRAAIKKHEEVHHFTLNVTLNQFEDEDVPYIVVTLTDITHEIETQNKLKNLNDNLELLVDFKTKELQQLNENLEKRIFVEIKKSKEKDTILFRQNKMAAMGEMINNIAHQWRQPLNAVTTAASSIILQSELGSLEKKSLEQSCNYILEHANYLSQTIENFRNFYKEDEEKQHFMVNEALKEDLALIKEKLKNNHIKVITSIKNEYSIFGYKNEFQQAVLNVIQNSIDALTLRKEKDERFLFIELFENVLTIKDNAQGVSEDILEKIFEPYFTTKHQSQGTGIGLYMTQEILSKHMNCVINARNISFKYEDKIETGFIFEIVFKN